MRQVQARKRDQAAGGLTFPIRLRCTSLADLAGEPELESALTRALGKSFAKARSALPPALSTGGGVALKAPQLVDGGGLGEAQASALLIRIRRAIEAAARAQSLQRVEPRLPRVGQRPSPQPAKNAPAKDVGEHFNPARFDADSGSYDVPSYDNAGAPTPLPVQQTPPPTMLKSEILNRLDNDDRVLLDDLFESTPYAQVLEVMIDFEKRSPKKFLAMLREKIKRDATVVKFFQRTQSDLKATDFLVESSGKLMRILKDIPAGRVIIREQTQKNADVARLVGLVEALTKTYEQLIAYLKTRKDPISAAFIDRYSDRIAEELPRLSGLFLIAAGTSSGKDLLPDLIKDVGEQVRWIIAVIEKLKEIDGWIDLYQLLFGPSSDQTEEVVTLREARRKYLIAIWQNLFPTTARIAAISKEPDQFYADWRGVAGDTKLEKIKKGLAEARSLMSHAPDSQSGGGYTALDWAYKNKRTLVQAAISEADKDVAKNSSAPSRDAEYLAALNAIERKVPEIVARVQLLHLWYSSISIQHQVEQYNIGDDYQRQGYFFHEPIMNIYTPMPGWYDRLDAIRREIALQFDQPNYSTLNTSYRDWEQRLEAIQNEIQVAARHEFYVTLGITIFATIVTAGLFAGAGVSVAVVLAEAGTFTLINTVGQAVLLGKPIDPGDVIGDFAENAVMFGAFKGLNILAAAGAKAIAPGKVLAQLGIAFTTTTLVATGVPALLTVIQGKEMPEEAKISLVVNLVVNAAMTLVGGLKTRNKIRDLQEVNLAARTQLIQDLESQSNASAEIMKELDEFIKSPDLKPEKFEDLKRRSADVLPKFEKSLNRLAGSEFSDAALAKLGLTRAMVQDMAKSVADAGRLIAGAKYVPTSKASALPGPGKVIGGLVQTGESTFEYNPAERGQTPAQVSARLLGAGYQVEDEGGGVLRVAAPKTERAPYLLLPAARPGAAEVSRGLLERAVGYHPEAEMATIAAELDRVFPNLAKTLQDEFPDETALATLKFLADQRTKLTGRWPKDAVRGLAELLKPDRGVPANAIRKLFQALPPDQLGSLLKQLFSIVGNSNVRPGANYLISDQLSPAETAKLVNAYDAIRSANLKLPETMSPKAIRGLLTWIEEGADVVANLKAISDVGQRATTLEGVKPAAKPNVKQGSRVLAPEQRLARAAEVERVKGSIASESFDVVSGQEKIDILEAKLKAVQENPVPRPAALGDNAEFKRFLRESNLQAKLESLGRLEQTPDLGTETGKYLAWLREVLKARDALDTANDDAAVARDKLARLKDIELVRATEALRKASLAIKDLLRTEGPNYRKLSSSVSHDQIIGEDRWNDSLRDLPRGATPPRLATDHLVSLERIANMSELTDFLLAYEKAPTSARQKMTADLVALGDIPENLMRMRKDANESKGSKSWNQITYAQMKRFGYEHRDVDAARAAEAKALSSILKMIGEMTDRYK
jgi:hypothetical protein